MSITSDVRSYADSALEQGRQVVDLAQARLTGVRGEAAVFATKAYTDLRTRGEALYQRVSTHPVVERVSATAEPYVAELNGYRAVATETAESLYADLKKNEQMAKVLGVAETAAGVVVETVNDRVVTPVRSLLDREPAPAATATASAAATAPPAAPAMPVAGPAEPAAWAPAEPASTQAASDPVTAPKPEPKTPSPGTSAAKPASSRTTSRRTAGS